MSHLQQTGMSGLSANIYSQYVVPRQVELQPLFNYTDLSYSDCMTVGKLVLQCSVSTYMVMCKNISSIVMLWQVLQVLTRTSGRNR